MIDAKNIIDIEELFSKKEWSDKEKGLMIDYLFYRLGSKHTFVIALLLHKLTGNEQLSSSPKHLKEYLTAYLDKNDIIELMIFLSDVDEKIKKGGVNER